MSKFSLGFIAMVFFSAGCASQKNAIDSLDSVGHVLAHRGCGAAAVISDQSVPNNHVAGVMITERKIHCAGLDAFLLISSVASKPEGMPVYLEVFKPRHELPKYINVGAPGKNIRAFLGDPAEYDANGLTYYIDGLDSSTIKFFVEQGLIAKIRWDWYVD